MDGDFVVPVRFTLLETAMLVEMDPAHPHSKLAATYAVPLTEEQIERLRDACPDENDEPEAWQQ